MVYHLPSQQTHIDVLRTNTAGFVAESSSGFLLVEGCFLTLTSTSTSCVYLHLELDTLSFKVPSPRRVVWGRRAHVYGG